jgi:hypothetical protein
VTLECLGDNSQTSKNRWPRLTRLQASRSLPSEIGSKRTCAPPKPYGSRVIGWATANHKPNCINSVVGQWVVTNSVYCSRLMDYEGNEGVPGNSPRMACSCNPATWRLRWVDGLRSGPLRRVVLCRSGVRTKPGINMVGWEESRPARLSKEGRIGPGRERSRQKSPCRAVVGSRP